MQSVADTLTSPDRLSFLVNTLKETNGRQGHILEFGVGPGISLKQISMNTNRRIFGFDSFEGLPENWALTEHVIFAAGSFKYDPPETARHVDLVSGWFEDTIPTWKEQYSGPIAFIHIDSDLYSSCHTILTELNDRIIPGTVLLFDEMFIYKNWEHGEWKAYNEWVKTYSRETYEIGRNHTQAAYRVIV